MNLTAGDQLLEGFMNDTVAAAIHKAIVDLANANRSIAAEIAKLRKALVPAETPSTPPPATPSPP